ncbi:putative L-ascorbate 6-phosphate lactonase [Coriobacterium glomerans PW2]|uniref:L-ascorbate 6-phosphate lactonase n=1 Tax=Coriobacterium glomerans (strain ATCC 49209 / DSM 20642 / JCM 10262 / PW2) TaxID=700015 RepID=F2NAT6_CORGP|nr:L-ascorbate 6-phosphate lactonase [Coriobacterium glomerans]AEB07614.1 putative L-ascorbate 6-phosphate lactonase [Coriobacterium glomerans PW2]
MSAKCVQEVTQQSWINEVFPEWGTWLNEEIDRTEIEHGTFGMWWLTNMGVMIKSDKQTQIAIDLWCGPGKRTHDAPDMGPRHQWSRLTGGRKIQPNLRAVPMVINPFAIHRLDALLCTHFHHDHIDLNVAAAILQGVEQDIPFIGPKFVVDQWIAWGVPAERCVTVRPGDTVKVHDIEIDVCESFDRTVLITDQKGEPVPEGKEIPDMDERAVNFVVKTDAGSVYHGGDSHFATMMAEHGKRFDIDVAIVAYAENPIAVTDKMTSSDVLRAAESLGCRVVVPVHWDVWSNMLADPQEVIDLWRMRRDRMGYTFYPFAWLPGGSFIYPRDAEKIAYFHDRGFSDHHMHPTDVPYPSFL